MSNDELDLSWAQEQIAGARVPVPVGNATLALLKAWGEVSFPNKEQEDQALKLFAKLARNEAVVEDNREWKPVQIGFMLRVGDTVRVRRDAFQDNARRGLNGRVGKVVAKRSGDIVVRSTDDKKPFIDSAHFHPSALELLVG
jgi:hypothetical protein